MPGKYVLPMVYEHLQYRIAPYKITDDYFL